MGTFVRLLALLTIALILTSGSAAAAGDVPPVLHGALPERLIVPRIDIDAPIVSLGIDADGAMESPSGPDPVGWYTFSPTPGNPGNAVFSGHRDWRTGVTGVFWSLNSLEIGDRIAVTLADGTELSYAVQVSVLLAPDEIPIGEIVGQTAEEGITLITCEGSFDRATREYDKRRIIWATRIQPTAADSPF